MTDPNYHVSYIDGTVTVTPTSLTITASSGSMTYGSSPPAITPSVGGLQNGEDISVLGAGLECSTSAVSSSPVGTFASMCSGAADPNYSIVDVDGSVTVDPAALTITASSASTTYGQDPPAVTASYDGFVNGDSSSSLIPAPICSTTATASSSAGTYDTSCTGADDPNYTIGYVDGSVNVAAAPLTITASSAPITYGQSPPSITPSYQGFVNGDSASSLTTGPSCSTTATSSSSAGTYPSTCTGAVDTNYAISYVDGAVVIGPASLIIVASNGSTTYGQSPPTITPSYEGFTNGDTASSLTTAPTCSTAATSASAANTYSSTCTGAVDPDYAITYVDGSVTVSPAPLSITASSSSITYGQSPPAVTASYDGFVNGDSASSLAPAPTCSAAATSSSSTGTYSSTCSGAVDPNYDDRVCRRIGHRVTGSALDHRLLGLDQLRLRASEHHAVLRRVRERRYGVVAVLVADLLVASPGHQSGRHLYEHLFGRRRSQLLDRILRRVGCRLAGPDNRHRVLAIVHLRGAAPSITPSVTGLQNGEDPSVLGPGLTCTTTATSSSSVGTYDASCSGGDDPNYAITYSDGVVTVGSAPITVTASSGTFAYGGTPPTITPSVTGLQNGETASVLGNNLACSTTATSSSPVGTYSTSCSGASDPNYGISYVGSTVEVVPVPLAVAASSGSMTYGGTVSTITPSYSGFVNGDTASALTTAPTCVTMATSNSPVGTYSSTCSGASDPNYTVSYVNGSVVVGASTLVISASSGTMTYGGSAPAVAPSYSGFVNGDTPASLSSHPVCTTSASSSSAVGNYATSCSGASDPNYNISYVNGSVHVTPAPISITASSASIVYGSSAPAITPSIKGLVNGQSASVLGGGLTCSSSAGPTSPVGSYASSCSGASDSNYSITYLSGTVQVTAATLTVKANNQSMNFGSAVPTLTTTITGFADGQTLATSGVTGQPVCTTTATNMSPAGGYPITCTIGTLAAANYTFTFAPGTLTVTNTQTIVCNIIGQVTVSAGQSVKIAPGCIVIGSVTVNAGGALDVEGAIVLGHVASSGSLRICSSSVALILQATGSAAQVVVGDGTTACEGSTLIGGINLSSNNGGVSLQGAGALGVIYVQKNAGSVKVINNQLIGILNVTGNTGTVVDHPNTVFGSSTLQ